jgi:hypothetical protein
MLAGSASVIDRPDLELKTLRVRSLISIPLLQHFIAEFGAGIGRING